MALYVVPALIVAAGFVLQARTVLNHDVGWILYSTRMLLQGAAYGKDIVEPNPPLIWWISAAPVFLADQFAIPVWGVFRVFVVIVVVACLAVADRFLLACGSSWARRVLFLAVGSYLFTIGASRDFGQREHLAAMLVLPYLFAAARRMDGLPVQAGPSWAIGVTAGLALALKPYFIGIPVLIEVLLLWRSRSLRPLMRPEALGGLVAVMFYAIAVVVFARPWLTGAAPEIMQIYWAFETPAPAAFVLIKKFALIAVGGYIALRHKTDDFGAVLIAAALGFAFAAFLQGKYYTYHAYPAYALMVLALAVSFDGLDRMWKAPMIGILLITLIQDLSTSSRLLASRSADGEIGRSYQAMAAFVRSNTPAEGSFLAVSTHPYPGFPTALYADRRWASASNSQFYLPAVVKLRERQGAGSKALRQFAEDKAREAIARDLGRKPELVLVDLRANRHAIEKSKFDYLKFYMEDAAFRALWSNYVPLADPPTGFAAYVRKEPGGR